MQMTTAQLREWITLAKELGLEELRIGDFYARFSLTAAPAPPVSEPIVKRAPAKPAEPKSLWHHPSLWPGGEPPKFPNKE
jgi:hypothetical protein